MIAFPKNVLCIFDIITAARKLEIGIIIQPMAAGGAPSALIWIYNQINFFKKFNLEPNFIVLVAGDFLSFSRLTPAQIILLDTLKDKEMRKFF